MFDHPDSALHILEKMEKPSSRTDKENHALWCLLTSQAKVKLIMKIPSDSLVKIAYKYYKSTNNARRKAMAALYMGNINYNLGNIEEALGYYLEGKTSIEKTEDYKTGYLIMSSLCQLYLYRNFADYAIEAGNEAFNYAKKDCNERYQMTSLGLLARCYCLLKKLPKAIETYQLCCNKALDLGLGDNEYYYGMKKEMALVYTNSWKFEKSLEILKTLPKIYQPSLLIGTNYLMLNQYDSAYLYLNKALITNNVYTKKSVYESLYKLGDNPKYRKYLKSYCDSLLYYNDSIMALDKGKEIVAYKAKYDNEKLISEKQSLKLEKANIIFWWMFTILIVLLMLVLLIYIFLHKRIAIHKKEEEVTNLALQLHQRELEVEKNESYIRELQLQYRESNKKEEFYTEQIEMLERLKKENERLNMERNILHEKISTYSISSNELHNVKILSEKVLQLEKREKDLCSLLMKQIPFLHKLHLNPIYLTNEELSDICKIADTIFQNFTQQLLKDVPTLSEHEIVLCSLIKLHFSITEISIFLNIAPTSVSRSKLRIKNKIYSQIGGNIKENNLDVWLWKY